MTGPRDGRPDGSSPSGELPDAVRRKVLGLLGLGARGRLVTIGVEQVRMAAQKGTLALAVVARDASRHSLDKVEPLLRARRVMMVEWPSAAELGDAVGRTATAAIGIVDQALARGIRGAMAGAPPAGDATQAAP